MNTQTHTDSTDDQLRLLGQLVGTQDPRGLQDMRDIVKRERERSAAMLAALRLARVVCEDAVIDARIAFATADEAAARTAWDAVKAAIAKAEGNAPVVISKAVVRPSMETQALRMGWQFDVQADEAGEWAWFRSDPAHDDDRAVLHGTGWRVYVESAYEAVAEGAR